MAATYQELLDATIQHLRDLKEHGVRFVPVRRETLAALVQAPATQRPSAPVRMDSLQTTALSPRRGGSDDRAPISSTPRPATTPVTVPSAPLPSTLDPQARAAAMAELRKRALVCVQCPNLAATRKNVVFGVGDIHAPLMFVGEAPGTDEDAQGEPFVGAAGQLLTKIIQTMGLSRDTVYIANILKCRPDPPAGTSGNRKPTPEEMNTCIPYLHAQIDLIQPRVLVALGATAVEGLLGKTGITRLRGQWHEYRGIPLMPTFHPSYLLRTQALADKRKVWEDMLAVMERLAMPISEKHRGYFLRA